MGPDYEIAIVGAGPAGAATALFLSAASPRLAERVVVFDKAGFPRDKICAGAVGGRADRVLSEIGVSIDVPAADVFGFHVRAQTGELRARCPHRIGRVVRRRAFDAALLDRVRETEITVRDGVRVDGLTRHPHGVDLSTSEGAVRVAAVVGADGVGSLVRRQLGFHRGHYYAQVVEVDTPASEADVARDYLSFDVRDRGLVGYAWDFPTVVDGAPRMCRGVYSVIRGHHPNGEPARDATAVLQARLSRQGVTPTSPFRRFAERGLSLHEPLSVERVILVGEAAGIDPVLGEGIPQAILYGKTAAAFLVQCFDRRDYRFLSYRRAMRAARVGMDLRARAILFRFAYGRTRPWFERWVTSSPALAHAGMAYFAGERVSRSYLARAAGDALTQVFGHPFSPT